MAVSGLEQRHVPSRLLLPGQVSWGSGKKSPLWICLGPSIMEVAKKLPSRLVGGVGRIASWIQYPGSTIQDQDPGARILDPAFGTQAPGSRTLDL